MATVLTPEEFIGAAKATAPAQMLSPDEFLGASNSAPSPSTLFGLPAPGTVDYARAMKTPVALPKLAQPQIGMPSDFPQLAYGATSPWMGATQMLAHGIADVAPNSYTLGRQKTIDAAVQRQAHAADEEAQGIPGTGIARLAGNVISTAPLAAVLPGGAAASLPRAIAENAATGGIVSGMQPVTNPGDFWGQKGAQAATGALSGGALGVAGRGIARLVSPEPTESVANLIKQGVRLTPGQRFGGIANSIEQKLTSMPVLGETIANARAQAVKDFNRATINQALAPIGQSLGNDTPLGHEAISEMADKIGGAYDKLLPNLTVQQDPQFVANMGLLEQNAKDGMLPDRTQQLSTILQNKLFSKFSPGGGMTGEGWKEAESELGRLGAQFRSSADADQRQLGGAIQQAQAELRGLLARSNPQYADELQRINTSWAMAKRIENAATRDNGRTGGFSAPQLVAATKALDHTRGKTAFARGNALMQDWAENGRKVLANTVPDSGTAGRGELIGVPGALYGLYEGGFPHLALGTSAGLLGGMAAYSRPGMSLFNFMANDRPSGAPMIARGIRRLIPYMSAASGTQTGRAVAR